MGSGISLLRRDLKREFLPNLVPHHLALALTQANHCAGPSTFNPMT